MASVEFPAGWLDDRWNDLTHAGPLTWLAVAIWVTLALAVLALLVTARQLRRSAALRTERERPYVAVFMEPHAADWHLVELVVRNFGRTAAYDIEFAFATPLTVAAYEHAYGGYTDVVPLALPKKLTNLAPGQDWRLVWDSARDRAQIGGQIESRFTGAVTYYDRPATTDRWWRRGRRQLRSEVVLDWASLPPTQRIELLTSHDLARREKQKLELLRGVLAYFQYAAKETRPDVLRGEIDRIDRAAREVQDRWRTRQPPDPEATVALGQPDPGRHQPRTEPVQPHPGGTGATGGTGGTAGTAGTGGPGGT